MTELALWALVLLPAVVGGLLALTSRMESLATAVSVGTAALTTALAVVVALTRPAVSVPFMAGSDLALGVDGLSALVAPMVATVTLLVLIAAAGEIRQSRSRFHGLMLLFAASALLTATAQTLTALLLAWEVMGATSFALIGFWWQQQHRVSAGITAFITTRAADLGIYLAAGAALAGGAGLSLDDLSAASQGWRHVVAAGLLVGALGKAAQLPFSFWLSRAMEGPSPVSALLHSAAMVAMGGYLLLRTAPLLQATGWAAPTAAWVGALTALALGVVALAQRDLKQLLAASTSAQLGFVIMGAGLAAVGGGTAHLLAHAAVKALLFLAAGAWLTALGTKQLAGLRGVGRRWPLLGAAASLGALALAGVAPLSLWATKDAVLAAALHASPWLYAVGLVAAALSAAYAGKILLVLWRPLSARERAQVDAHAGEEQPGTGQVGLLEQTPLLVLAAAAVALGLFALPPVGDLVASTVGESAPIHPSALQLLGTAILTLVVLLALWRRPPPEPRWARQWLGMEYAAHLVIVRPTLRLAHGLARFDDRVLDRAVTGTAAAVVSVARGAATVDDRVLDRAVTGTAAAAVSVARRAASVDDRWVDGAVEGLAGAVRRVGRLARRPQTGQLHQYYVQALAVLAGGILLLLLVR